MSIQPLFTIHRKEPTPVIGRDPALTLWFIRRLGTPKQQPMPLLQKLLSMFRK